MRGKNLYYKLRGLIALLFSIPFIILYAIAYNIFLYIFLIFIPLVLSFICFTSLKEMKQDFNQIIKEAAVFSFQYKPTLNLKIWQ